MKICIECESPHLTEAPRKSIIRGQQTEWTEYRCLSCGHEDHETDEADENEKVKPHAA